MDRPVGAREVLRHDRVEDASCLFCRVARRRECLGAGVARGIVEIGTFDREVRGDRVAAAGSPPSAALSGRRLPIDEHEPSQEGRVAVGGGRDRALEVGPAALGVQRALDRARQIALGDLLIIHHAIGGGDRDRGALLGEAQQVTHDDQRVLALEIVRARLVARASVQRLPQGVIEPSRALRPEGRAVQRGVDRPIEDQRIEPIGVAGRIHLGEARPIALAVQDEPVVAQGPADRVDVLGRLARGIDRHVGRCVARLLDTGLGERCGRPRRCSRLRSGGPRSGSAARPTPRHRAGRRRRCRTPRGCSGRSRRGAPPSSRRARCRRVRRPLRRAADGWRP